MRGLGGTKVVGLLAVGVLLVACDEPRNTPAGGLPVGDVPVEDVDAGAVLPKPDPEPMPGDAGTGPATLTESGFCPAYAQATCEVSQACCSGGFDLPSCLSYVGEACLQAYGQSTLPYDGEKASACEAEIRGIAPACATITLQTEPNACSQVRVNPNAKKAGETCSVAAGDCGVGLLCLSNAAPGTGSTCQSPRAAGESCRRSGDCSVRLYCDTSSGAGLCTERKAVGAACTDSAQCVSNVCRGTPRTCDTAESTFCGLGVMQ